MYFKNKGLQLAAGFFATCALGASTMASAGSFDVFGTTVDWKLTTSYGMSVRAEDPDPFLSDGPISQQQVEFDPVLFATNPQSLGLRRLDKTGLPYSVLFDDGSRDFRRAGSVVNNRLSAFGEFSIDLYGLGLGNMGIVGSGAAHYDMVYLDNNQHDNPDSVNRADLQWIQEARANDYSRNNGVRVGPVNDWNAEVKKIGGKRGRLLEMYLYGDWYLTDSIAVNLRAGRHLAAWGESLFFPGIVTAQGPFDATKAFIPGAEVKEIILPVNQVSTQVSLTRDITLMAYKQFEFYPTDIFPQGDFFSPADLVGPGANLGHGSINPVHDEHCTTGEEITIFITNPGGGDPQEVPEGNTQLCDVGDQMTNKPEYVWTFRKADDIPDPDGQYGFGVKYQLLTNLSLGAYHLKYHNHNPKVDLTMGYAYVGNLNGQDITTENFGDLQVPVEYTVGYADNITMNALSFSTVFWVFNIAGEIIQRQNIDTSLEAVISGETVPWGTRGDTTSAQVSFLYVNNPNFLMYDEVVVIGEFMYMQVDDVVPVNNANNICFTGTECGNFNEEGTELFYDEKSAAAQFLMLPKGRNVFPGWDIGTPASFAWLFYGTPSVAGQFGALYGEGDMRASLGVTAQYLQNLEFALSYNALLGDPEALIRNSTLPRNPYADKDYVSFSIKYNI